MKTIAKSARKKGGRTERFTVAQVEKALRDSGGIQTHAAKKLGITRQSVAAYLVRHPELQTAMEQIIEETIDTAEAQLFKHLKAGNLTSVIFYLKTKGVQRGYNERQEITGAGGGPVVVEIQRFGGEVANPDPK